MSVRFLLCLVSCFMLLFPLPFVNASLAVTAPAEESSSEKIPLTEETISSLHQLLGKTDDEVVALMGRGKVHLSRDRQTVVSRSFVIPVFHEIANAGVLYDASGRANVVTMLLYRPKDDAYLRELLAIYGKPDHVNSVPSEGGATYKEWAFPDSSTMRLYQEYELCALELVMPDSVQPNG